MKIALAQINPLVGDWDGNARKMERLAQRAAEQGAQAILFPCSARTGAPLLGLAPPPELPVVESPIPVYTAESLFGEALLSPAAERFRHGLPVERLGQLAERAKNERRPVVYVNATGAQTDTLFYGGSAVCWPDGRCLTLPLFTETLRVVDLNDPIDQRADWGAPIAQVCDGLLLGIRDYFAKTASHQAVVALSGGLDSAVVVALAAVALGPEHVRVLLLPSPYSSAHSVDDSLELVRRLGIRSDLLPITPIFEAALQSLAPIFAEADCALAEENLQSRIRGLLTMALSNAHGGLMLNTSNKSEIAVGYGTLYGDTSGALSVLGDLYKTEVYALADHINVRYGNPIPANILAKAPSAELRPGQQDSDSLPPYPELDRLLYGLIEQGLSPRELIDRGEEPSTVERVARLLKRAEFKRRQLPPALRVSAVGFGHEWVRPIVAF